MPSAMERLRALGTPTDEQIDAFVDSLTPDEVAELSSQPGFKETFKARVGEPARVDEVGVVQEQHPMISLGDRMLVQNLAGSREDGAAYLRDRYKKQGLEVKIINDQIVVKTPKDKHFKVVDPNTGFFSNPAEMAKDLGDVAFDVGSGAALGAAMGPLGPAAIGARGAAAAAGLGGAGAEALRQGLGQVAGVNQSMDAEQVAMMGAVGALGPTIGKGMNVAYDVATRRMLPKAAATASGVPEQVWKHFQVNPGRHIELSMDPKRFKSLVDETAQTIVQGFQNKEKELWGKMAPLYKQADEAGSQVSMGPVIEDIDKLINKYTRPNPTPAEVADLETLKKVKADYLQTVPAKGEEVGTNLSTMKPSQALAFRQKLDDLADWERTPGAASADTITNEIQNFAKRARDEVSKQITQIAPELKALNAQYAETAEAFKNVGKSFKDPKTTLQTMMSWDSNAKRMVNNDVNMHLGDDFAQMIQSNLDDIQVQKYLGNPQSMAISSGGTTSTSRSVPLATILGSLGTVMGYSLGGGISNPVTSAVTGTIGGAAGIKLGTSLGSPAALRSGMTNMQAMEGMLQKAAPVTKPTLYGVWQSLANPQVINTIQTTPPQDQK